MVLFILEKKKRKKEQLAFELINSTIEIYLLFFKLH